MKRGSPFQTDVEFLHGSILTTSWESGDVVFCHGTCFSDKYVVDLVKTLMCVEAMDA